MSNLLERLRADNPVPSGSPPAFEEVWSRLQGESRAITQRRPWWRKARGLALGSLALIPVAAVVVIAITTLGHRRASFAGGGPGTGAVLVHYRARTVVRPAASSGASFAYSVDEADVWVSRASRHRIDRTHFYSRNGQPQGGKPVNLEIATDGRRLEHFEAGQLTESPATRPDSSVPPPRRLRCRRIRRPAHRG